MKKERLLGSSLLWSGTTFSFDSGIIRCAKRGIYDLLHRTSVSLLATAINGNRANQAFVVNYADGTIATFKQSLSVWHRPQGYPGESGLCYRWDIG